MSATSTVPDAGDVDVWTFLRRRWLGRLVVVAIVAGILGGVYGAATVEVEYTASGTVGADRLAPGIAETDSIVRVTDLFIELVENPALQQSIADEVDMTKTEVKSAIGASQQGNTGFLRITGSAATPEQATALVEATARTVSAEVLRQDLVAWQALVANDLTALGQLQTELNAVEERAGTVAPAERMGQLTEEITALETQIALAEPADAVALTALLVERQTALTQIQPEVREWQLLDAEINRREASRRASETVVTGLQVSLAGITDADLVSLSAMEESSQLMGVAQLVIGAAVLGAALVFLLAVAVRRRETAAATDAEVHELASVPAPEEADEPQSKKRKTGTGGRK